MGFSNGSELVLFGFFNNGLGLRPKYTLGWAKFILDTNNSITNWLKGYTFNSRAYTFDVTIVTKIPMTLNLYHIIDHCFDFLSLTRYTLLV